MCARVLPSASFEFAPLARAPRALAARAHTRSDSKGSSEASKTRHASSNMLELLRFLEHPQVAFAWSPSRAKKTCTQEFVCALSSPPGPPISKLMGRLWGGVPRCEKNALFRRCGRAPFASTLTCGGQGVPAQDQTKMKSARFFRSGRERKSHTLKIIRSEYLLLTMLAASLPMRIVLLVRSCGMQSMACARRHPDKDVEADAAADTTETQTQTQT